jgi:type IV pilus assembly protein PilA
MSYLRSSRAFTLIELLVVIVIIAILMAIAIPAYLAQQQKAQDAKTKQYLNYAFRDIRSATPETNAQYPLAASMVSVVQASEPQLTTAVGNCLTTVLSASPDAVIIDSSSSANSLNLCARSQSGNIWKLSASASGAHQLLDGSLFALNLAGNEMTDISRAQALQGDGRAAPDSSTGIWEATTNLSVNGGMETNANNWTGATAGASHTRDTSVFKFGSASMQVVHYMWGGGNVTTGGTGFQIPVTANQSYTLSSWEQGANGTPLNIQIEWTNAGGSTISSSTLAYSGASTWQRVSVTGVAPATAVSADLQFNDNGANAATYSIDGIQLEAKTSPTPYVETNGSSATRGAARVKVSASLLNITQGWVAFRMRPGWAATTHPYGGATFIKFFHWGDDPTHEVQLYYSEANNRYGTSRKNGAFTDSPNYGSESFSSGTPQTIISSWSATTVGVSVGGSNFFTSANNTIPSLTASTFDIGRNTASAAEWCDCDFLWFAAGTGTLSNSDAAAINAWGNTDPKRSSFPAAAGATFVWDGAGANGSLK